MITNSFEINAYMDRDFVMITLLKILLWVMGDKKYIYIFDWTEHNCTPVVKIL